MKNKNIRIGFDRYFIQFSFYCSWQILIRFGYRAIVFNKNKGFFIRHFDEELKIQDYKPRKTKY